MKRQILILFLIIFLLTVTASAASWEANTTITTGFTNKGTNSVPANFTLQDVNYIIAGNATGLVTGWGWNGASWVLNLTITSGITDIGSNATVSIFWLNNELFMIEANSACSYNGYKWGGSSWVSNSTIVGGLTDVGSYCKPQVVTANGSTNLIMGTGINGWFGFSWNGTAWSTNATAVSGLKIIGDYFTPTSFNNNGTLYMISGNISGLSTGYNWNGTGWTLDTGIVSGLPDTGSYASPTAFVIGSDMYYLTGDISTIYTGFRSTFYVPPITSFTPPTPVSLSSSQGLYWINNTWAAGAGIITDLYNVSVNGSWVNGSAALFYNSTGMSPHGWSNISVYAFNNTGTGTVNTTPATQNTQIANTAPVLTNTTNITVNEGETVTLDFGCTDSELDTCTYSLNRTDLFTDFSIVTGAGTWITDYSSSGVYALEVGASDGYGGIGNATVIITVNNVTAIPPVPTTLTNTTGTNWFRYAWAAGSGNITDSYNVNMNGTWTNHTINAFINVTGMSPHAWANISVYAYNATGGESLTALAQNTQLANTAPVLTNTTNITVNEGEKVTLGFGCTDGELDTCTYSLNRTDLFTDFSIVTGAGTWITDYSSNGVYALEVGTSDGYGGIGNATVTITVNNVTAIPPVPTTLTNTTGTNWFRYAWVAGSGNITDSYNVNMNGTWTNHTTATFLNTTGMAAHAWANISVYAYNATGGESLTALAQNTQLANNAPILSGINATYNILEGQTMIVDANFTDLDSDVGVFASNASLGSINSSTGVFTYTPTSAEFGIYSWNISLNDLNGGIAIENFTVTVSNNSVPSINASAGTLTETSAVITSITNQSSAISFIQYSLVSSLASALQTTNQTSNLTRSQTITNLTEGTTYYYSVFAYNNTNTSLFVNSTIANFTTTATTSTVIVSGGGSGNGGGGGGVIYIAPNPAKPLVTITQIDNSSARVTILNEGKAAEEYTYSVELRDWKQASVDNFIDSKLVAANENYSFNVDYSKIPAGVYNMIVRVRYYNQLFVSDSSKIIWLGNVEKTPTNQLQTLFMTAFLFLKKNILIMFVVLVIIVSLYLLFQYQPKPERTSRLRMPLHEKTYRLRMPLK